MSALLLILLACGAKPDPRVAELEAALEQMRSDMDDLEAAYVDQRQQLAEVDSDLSAVNTGKLGHDANAEVTAGQHASLKAELAYLKKQVATEKAALAEATELVEAVDEDLEAVEDDLDADDDGLSDIEERIDNLDERIHAVETTLGELDRVVGEHFEQTEGVAKLVKKLVVNRDGDLVVRGANLVMDSQGRPSDGTPNTKGNFFMVPPGQ